MKLQKKKSDFTKKRTARRAPSRSPSRKTRAGRPEFRYVKDGGGGESLPEGKKTVPVLTPSRDQG